MRKPTPKQRRVGGRSAKLARKTKETDVTVKLVIDGTGEFHVDTGIPFFDHLLGATFKHGFFDVELRARGDIEVDLHHTVEDVGIAFGDALAQALGERRGLVRFAHAYAPLDEALARAVVDLSGRGFFAYSAPAEIAAGWVTAEFPVTLTADFFQALADRGRLTLHLEILRARNPHHAVEAAFKAVALALRQAAAVRDPRGGPPSTKGTLSR
jgi:imidazoleglycerol-phosphate dehydratase